MIVDSRAAVIERVSVGLMLCGLMVQVAGLCWLPFNLHPEDGVGIADLHAFGLVLAGAGMVALGLVARAYGNARTMRASELKCDRDNGE